MDFMTLIAGLSDFSVIVNQNHPLKDNSVQMLHATFLFLSAFYSY